MTLAIISIFSNFIYNILRILYERPTYVHVLEKSFMIIIYKLNLIVIYEFNI